MTATNVIGTFKKPDGTACEGKLVFELVAPVYNASSSTVFIPEPVVGVLNGSGQLSVSLEPTDSPSLNVANLTYRVQQIITGYPIREYFISVPTSGVPVNIGLLYQYGTLPDITYIPVSGVSSGLVFSKTGTLSVGAGTNKIYNDTALPITITSVRATVVTAPTGQSIKVDVNKNGTTIFTTQANRPTIAISGTTVLSAAPDVTSWAIGEYLTVDIDQVGSVNPGADLTVQINIA